ncbi:hypothetical protein [Crateriforma spongiae]|uniref:hypothetical protein n=1 Tax=Crateriforma spongiae TaxID=2724528 RepID=UPI001445594E|nr:hypothetical protein [Crateriforma spongiae]
MITRTHHLRDDFVLPEDDPLIPEAIRGVSYASLSRVQKSALRRRVGLRDFDKNASTRKKVQGEIREALLIVDSPDQENRVRREEFAGVTKVASGLSDTERRRLGVLNISDFASLCGIERSTFSKFLDNIAKNPSQDLIDCFDAIAGISPAVVYDDATKAPVSGNDRRLSAISVARKIPDVLTEWGPSDVCLAILQGKAEILV